MGTPTSWSRSERCTFGRSPLTPRAIVLINLIPFAALFALACAVPLWKGPGPLQKRLLVWVLAACATEFTGFVLAKLGQVNSALFNVYMLVEFVLLLRLVALWPQGRAARSPWLIGGFTVFWAVEMWHIGTRPQMVAYSFLLGTLVHVTLYLLLLWAIVNEHRGPLSQHAPFWLCLSVLLFYGIAPPIFSSANYFHSVDPALASKLYRGVRVLAILKFVLMGITCLRARPAKLQAA